MGNDVRTLGDFTNEARIRKEKKSQERITKKFTGEKFRRETKIHRKDTSDEVDFRAANEVDFRAANEVGFRTLIESESAGSQNLLKSFQNRRNYHPEHAHEPEYIDAD